jgi:transcriptional regulator with XRE-family HTH domain
MKKPDGAIQLDVAALYEALDRERKRREMTLGKVAGQLNVSYATVSCWRRTASGMNADAALRIALWLDIDLRDFARPPDPLPATQGRALRHRGPGPPTHDRLPAVRVFLTSPGP